MKNNKREKRKYQKDYCTTRGVLCSKCNRRGRKGSEIKKKSQRPIISLYKATTAESFENEKKLIINKIDLRITDKSILMVIF